MVKPAKNVPLATAAQETVKPLMSDAAMKVLYAIATGELEFVTQELGSELLQAGYIQLDATKNDNAGGVKAMATEDGIKALTAAGMSPANGKQASLSFEIEDFDIGPKRVRAPKGQSTYPYDKLEVGQHFHIPATKDKPKPHKSFSSLIAQAKNHYAVPVKDANGNPVMETVNIAERKIKAKGDKAEKTIPARSESRQKMDYPRQFALYEAAATDPKGPGARFKRIK